MFGINPGRFGGGLTGLSFTDPAALRDFCGVENSLGKRRELSSTFVYRVIERYGGVKKFFSKFFLTALYPLAILEDGLNCNFYDYPHLAKILRGHLVESVRRQIAIGARRGKVICLGRKNALYLKEINDKHKLFEKMDVLNHPRWIMQYRLKSAEKYLEQYLELLK